MKPPKLVLIKGDGETPDEYVCDNQLLYITGDALRDVADNLEDQDGMKPTGFRIAVTFDDGNVRTYQFTTGLMNDFQMIGALEVEKMKLLNGLNRVPTNPVK